MNWKDLSQKDLFREAFNFDENIPYMKRTTNSDIKDNIKRDSNSVASSSHFVIALKDKEYEKSYPHGCLAIISIGIPKERDFDSGSNNDEMFYEKIFPTLKSKETFILMTQHN